MRKLFNVNLILLVGIIGILLLGFQNCAKHEYSATDVGSGSLNTDNLPDNSSTSVDQGGASGGGAAGGGTADGGNAGSGTAGGGTLPPVGGGGNTMPPTGGGTLPPVMSGDDKECVEYAKGSKDYDCDEKDGENNNYNQKSYVSKMSYSEDKEGSQKGIKCYVDQEDDDDEKDLAENCNMQFKLKSSSNNSGAVGIDILHRRGKLIITQYNIAHINNIEDFRGKLILCGVTVDKISNCRGKIVLVDSKVGEIQNHKGTIIVLGISGSKNVNKSYAQVAVQRKK